MLVPLLDVELGTAGPVGFGLGMDNVLVDIMVEIDHNGRRSHQPGFPFGYGSIIRISRQRETEPFLDNSYVVKKYFGHKSSTYKEIYPRPFCAKSKFDWSNLIYTGFCLVPAESSVT